MATASCNADAGSSLYAPYVTLTVTTSGGSSANSTCTVSYTLTYHTRGSTASTSNMRNYTITIDGQTISGSYSINGVSSGTIRTGSLTVNRGTGGAARTISFSVSFAFNLTWSNTYIGTVSGSGSVQTPSILYTYTVSYNANGGTGAPSSQTKTYGVTLKLSSTVPTRNGYRFVGWGTSSGASSPSYQPGSNYTSNSSITLYAIWTIDSFIISYNANGGTGAPPNQTKQNGVTLTLSDTEPTRKRHNFLGWATSADAEEATYQPGGSFITNADTTLFAVWQLTDDYILIYSTGVCEAVEFIEDDSGVMLQDGGKVYASEFIETEDGIILGNEMHFSEIEEV